MAPAMRIGETIDSHGALPMIDLKTIDDLARRLGDLVPPGMK